MTQDAHPEVDPRVERTRERVFGAVLDLLASEGIDAVTHSHVAEVSGVGRATLYRHWPELPAMLVDALSTRHLSLHAGDLDGATLVEAATMLVRRAATSLRDDPLAPTMLELLARADHDPTYGEVRRGMAQRMGGVMEAVLGAAKERGEVPDDLDLDHAKSLLAGPIFFARLVLARPFEEADVAPHVAAWLRAIDHRPA